jgi:hypothetical protein
MRAGVAIGLGVLALLALGRSVGATVANDLCPAAADPCLIAADHTVTSDSTLDFGTRTVMVLPGKSLDVGAGVMNIRAGVFRLQPNGKLLGAGGFISVTTTGAIDVQASGSNDARIDVSDVDGGGEIDLEAGGAVTIAGLLVAKGDDIEADGGDIFISSGGDMQVTAPLTVKGGSDAGGGTITFIAGGILDITEPMDASGGEFDGGDIDLTATGNLTVATRADFDITGGSLSGSGGSVELLSLNGNVSMGGRILGTAGGSVEEGGGFGGTVDAAAPVGGVAFLDFIDVFGGDGAGAGDGGDVTVMAGGPITISGDIDSRGGVDTTSLGANGGGGNVFLEGCDVTVSAGRTIDTTGDTFGTNVLRAGGQLRVVGTLRTAQSNVFQYRDPAKPPIVTGSVSPPPQTSQSCNVPPCSGVCGNGTLDACEACDPGDVAGDCCSASCKFLPLGTSCTGGVCNATGVCGPAPVTTSTTSTSTSSTVFGSTVPTTTSTSTSTTSSTTSTSTSTTSSTTTSTSSTTTTSTTLPPKCVGGTRKAAGSKIKGKLVCYAKAVKAGQAVDPDCLTKADQKFVKAFGKTDCPGTGAGVEVLADTCVAQLLLDVPGTDKCAATSLKAIGKAGGAILGCSAQGLKKPDKVTACLDKVGAKLTTKLAKAGGCTSVATVRAHLAVCLASIQPEPR